MSRATLIDERQEEELDQLEQDTVETPEAEQSQEVSNIPEKYRGKLSKILYRCTKSLRSFQANRVRKLES